MGAIRYLAVLVSTVVLLASEQPTDLVLLDAPVGLLADGAIDDRLTAVLAETPCDVGLLVPRGPAALEPGMGPPATRHGGADHRARLVEGSDHAAQ